MDTLNKLSLLVVDDEEDLKLLYTQKYRHEIKSGEIHFEFAHSGVEALAVLEQHPDISLVITDINMPEMDGLTLLGHIQEEYPETLTVVVTAYGDMDNIRASMNAGAFDFLAKPLKFDDMTLTLKKTRERVHQMHEAEKNKSHLTKILDELQVASNIQKSIIPNEHLKTDHCEVHGLMQAAKEVGGDFFDHFMVDDDHVGLVLGDVSGKGVPAALMMTVSRTLMRASGIGQLSPAACVQKVNETIFPDNEELMFVTLFYAILNQKTGRLRYTNAGHEFPLLISEDGTYIELKEANSIVLGVSDEHDYEDAEIQLKHNDTFMIYSDGLTDGINPKNKEFGTARLVEKYKAYNQKPPCEIITQLYNDLENFAEGCDQFDDVTMIIMRYYQQ